jgi:DNA polymerase III delta' subunit
MLGGAMPGALLLVGEAGVGKTTLATDIAAGLLCTAEPHGRPCGQCRSCGLVARGSHPDVHRLGPEGPGRQVAIGGPGSKVRGVRDLIAELALLPVEGGARIAIVEGAHRMNEDAQNALLKTLEEPAAGVTIILCADAEEPLLPTIRSRCARLRLGPVGIRDVEAILAEQDAAAAPVAARLARIAGGRPGIALAWARQPEALRDRDELARTLVDLVRARPSDRIAAMRPLLARAATLAAMGDGAPTAEPPTRPAPRSRDRTAGPPDAPPVASEALEPGAGTADVDDAAGQPARAPAVERRRAAEALVGLWMDVARDIALCQRGLDRDVRDPALLDETRAVAAELEVADVTQVLERLERAAVLLAGNVSPELVLDDLAMAWPRPRGLVA